MEPDTDAKTLSTKTLSDFLDEFFPPKATNDSRPAPQVVIFDQLEELFNLFLGSWREEQVGFFRQVAEALNKNQLLRIVFVIREDYLAQLDPFLRMLPEKLRPRFRLERLRKEAAISSIKGPLEKANYSFDMNEIEQIVYDLLKVRVETLAGNSMEIDGEFVEPIQLQVVCQKWWQERFSSKKITTDPNYLSNLADVDNALADFYTNSIRDSVKQTDVGEERIRRWCETNLITSSGTRSIIHLDPEVAGSIPTKAVEILVDHYLIRREWRSGAPWYELTHDRLIKPIKDSNKEWNEERKKKRSSRRIKILIPTTSIIIVIALAISIAYISPLYFTNEVNQITSESIPFFLGQFPSSIGVKDTILALDSIVYISNPSSNSVSVLNGTDNTLLQNITHVGQSPTGIAVNSFTNLIYISNPSSNSVSVLNGTDNTLLQNITHVGQSPTGIAVNSFTNLIYISNPSSNSVSVLNGTDNTIIKSILLSGSPTNLSVNQDTNLIYVAVPSSNSIYVLNGTVNEILSNITSKGELPIGIATSSISNRIYMINGSESVYVIDGTLNRVIANIPLSEYPTDVGVNPETNVIYVTSPNSLYLIDGVTNTFLQPGEFSGTQVQDEKKVGTRIRV